MKKILLILVVCIMIFVFTSNKICSTEKFTDICLQSSYTKDILSQNNKLITSLDLNNQINDIIQPLVKPNIIDRKITLEKYLDNKKIPKNKIPGVITLINNIVNNNRLVLSSFTYKIKGNTLLFNIVSVWNADNLINSMLCLINDRSVIADLIKQLFLVIISPKIEFCSKDNFQKHCEKSYQNYLKEITPKVKVITQVKLIPKVEVKPVTKVEVKPVTKVVAKIECGLVTRSGDCTANYNPVLCSDGKIYSNSCKASLAGCSNCSSNKVVAKEAKATGVKVTVVNKKELEKFTQKLDETKKNIQKGSTQIFKIKSNPLPLISNSSKYMDIHSLSEHLQKFNSKSLGSTLEPSMIKLMSIYKRNNNKDFNILDKKEFGKIVVILVDDIKLTVNKIIDEDDFSKLKPFVDEFNNLQKIFYLLKHNYKLLLAYELINNKIKKDDEKLQTQLCCSKTGEKSCFNFSANPKNSSAILYGFNELGYVNSVKCIKEDESSKKLEKEQNMTIDDLFNEKYASWRNLTKENKSRIFANVINYLLIFGIKLNKIDDKIINIRKQLEENKNKITMSDIMVNKIPIELDEIIKQTMNNSHDKNTMIEKIKKTDSIDKLNEIVMSLGYTKDHIMFNNNMDLLYAKNITEELFKYIDTFKIFKSNDPIIIGKLFGIIKTNETFSQIMKTTNILPRYHYDLIESILKKIVDKKFAIVRPYTMNSLPGNTIHYLQSKPSGKDLNFCNVHEEFLLQLRKDRSITNDEFNKYLQQSYLYCNPNKVNITDIKSITIPINNKKGLAIIDRNHKSYDEFVKENKEIVKNKLVSKVVSDNILYNTIKNSYN